MDKKVTIYGGYRNEAFYENFYKNMNADEAYRETMIYLEKPTFKFEKDCAMKVYEAKFGKFKSAETKKMDNQEAEIERLKAIIAANPITPNRSATPLEPSNEVDRLKAIITANPMPIVPSKEEIERLKTIIPVTPVTPNRSDNPYPVSPTTPYPVEPPTAYDEIPDAPPVHIDFKDFPKGLDKAEFKKMFFPWFEESQGIIPSDIHYGKAWKEYQKNV